MARVEKVTPCVVAGLTLGMVSVASAQADHLECYRARDFLAAAKYQADLSGLAVEPGCVVKVPAKLLCVATTEANIDPPPPGAPAGAEAGTFVCYKTKCPRAKPSPVDVVDQFGVRPVQPKAAKLLCAPATIAGPTTTTTLPTTRCCQGLGGPICSDRPAATIGESCGGTVAPAGFVCDGATGDCAAERTGVSNCCQVSGPLCFEGPLAGLACTTPDAGLVPGAACTPAGICVVP